MSKFLVVGEALVDIVETPDGAHASHPGGSPANVALTAARLGRDTALLTWIADDSLGQTIAAHLAASGVTVLPQSFGAARTPRAIAQLDHGGSATYEFDLDWELAPVSLDDDVVVLHTGSVAAVAPTEAPRALQSLLADAHECATVSYDPNLRPTVMGSSAAAVRTDVEALIALADIVKVSDDD